MNIKMHDLYSIPKLTIFNIHMNLNYFILFFLKKEKKKHSS